jgi:hypothetical protein
MLSPTRLVVPILCVVFASVGVVRSQDEKKPAEEKDDKKLAEKKDDKKPIEVRLVAAGKDPKRPLRLVVAKGVEQRVVLTSRHQRVQGIKGGVQFPPLKFPAQRTTIRIVVENVAENGDMTCRFKFLSAAPFETEGVQPEIVETVREQARAIAGYAGTMVVSSRGIVLSVAYDEPKATLNVAQQKAIAGVRDMVKELSVPFPTEPVGIGAKWTVTRPVDSNGIKLTRVESYELTKLENDLATIQVLVTQSAKNQQLPAPPGSKVKVTIQSLDSKGTGERVVSLSKVAPRKGSLTVIVKGDMVAEYLGKKQERVVEERIRSELIDFEDLEKKDTEPPTKK